MKEYVDTILKAQAEPDDRRQTLEHRGSVDVAYSLAVRHGFEPAFFTAVENTRS